MLQTGAIEIAPYDPHWAARAAGEMARLSTVAGQVEHIGTTALPGRAGRPLIDLMVGARMLDRRAAQVVTGLGGLGYELATLPGIPAAFCLWHPGKPFVVHVVELGAAQWKRNLALRDFLRAFGDDAEAFERVRRGAAGQAKNELEYSELKRPSLERLSRRAEIWRLSHPR
jgi:GrpB-like predicted nucleotidyltransferase (UPF0157 family)